MKRIFAYSIVAAAVVSGIVRASGASDERGRVSPARFLNPPDECRPRCWWSWMNGNVSKEGIARDLAEMAKVGIGGATIFDLGGSIVAGPVEGYTPSWYEHVRFAGEEAVKNGLDLAVHNCAGWTASGAPWITPENSMKRLMVSDITLEPGETFRGKFPVIGEVPRGWMKEISLIAYAAPAAEKVAPPAVDFVREGTNRYVLTLPKAYEVTGFEFRHKPHQVWEWMRTAYFKVESSDDGKSWRDAADLRLELFNNGFPLARDERLAVSLGKGVKASHFRFTFDAPNTIGNVYELAELRLTCNSKVVPDVKARSIAYRQGFAPIPDAPDAVIDANAAYIDVSRFLKKDGTFEWTAPKTGRLWIVQRTAAVSTGATNGPDPGSRGGLECDKLDKRGIDAIWAGYVGKLRGMKGLKAVLCDSWEVGSQNWTDILPAEFKARRGYAVDRFWPAFTGRIVESPQATEKFFRDWRKTIAELFTENYSNRFRDLAHRDGLKYLCEPYGNPPADFYAYARSADLPMSEFWVKKAEDIARNAAVDENSFPDERCIRRVASAVHFHGKAFADAESFTCSPQNGGKWSSGLSIHKACGDAALASGINRFTYHSITHQPWKDRYLPGAVMNIFGTISEINSPMWPMMKPMVKYHTRLHYLLSRGRSVSRLLYIAPDDPLAKFPKGGFPTDITYDIIGADDAALVKTEGGRIVAPSGVAYEAIVLADDAAYEYASAADVKRFKASGVKIFRDGEKSFAGITRDFLCTGARARVRTIRRDYADGASGFFVAYPGTNAVTLTCSFAVKGRFPESWDAETGKRSRLDSFREENGRTLVTLNLDPYASAFVYFAPTLDKTLPPNNPSIPQSNNPTIQQFHAPSIQQSNNPTIQQFSHFTLSFPDGWGCGGPYKLDKLVSWTTLGGETQYFSGTAVYETTFTLAQSNNPTIQQSNNPIIPQSNNPTIKQSNNSIISQSNNPTIQQSNNQIILLDLGDVRETAEVFIDGKSVGMLWKPPYRIDITEALQQSNNPTIQQSNTPTIPHSLNPTIQQSNNPTIKQFSRSHSLRIVVANSLANRLIGDAKKPEDCVWWKGDWREGLLKEIPQWVRDGKPSPTGRHTFSLVRHYKGTEQLLPAGLLGPVTLSVYRGSEYRWVSMGSDPMAVGKQ